MTVFTCSKCGQIKDRATEGVAIIEDKEVCYLCSSEVVKADMIQSGRARLYLGTAGKVTDWPGTLSFDVARTKTSTVRCFGRPVKRVDLWFTGPDGDRWHGVHIGENNDFAHCKRAKVGATRKGGKLCALSKMSAWVPLARLPRP